MAVDGLHEREPGDNAPGFAWLAGGLTALLCFGLVFVNGPDVLWLVICGVFFAFGAGLACASSTRRLGVGVMAGAGVGVCVAFAFVVAAMSTIYS